MNDYTHLNPEGNRFLLVTVIDGMAWGFVESQYEAVRIVVPNESLYMHPHTTPRPTVNTPRLEAVCLPLDALTPR